VKRREGGGRGGKEERQHNKRREERREALPIFSSGTTFFSRGKESGLVGEEKVELPPERWIRRS